MTPPVPDAMYLAPIVLRLNTLEGALVEQNDLLDRLRQDNDRLQELTKEQQEIIKELRIRITGQE